MKEKIRQYVNQIGPKLEALSDRIYDLAEISCQEFQSCRLLEDYLKENGFQVEHGVGGMETAFRAVYEQGEGGPSFGLLAEYDALSMGHGCGHQMQGPAIIGPPSASGSWPATDRTKSSYTEPPPRKAWAERSSCRKTAVSRTSTSP